METTLSGLLDPALLNHFVGQTHLWLKFLMVGVLVSYIPIIAYIYSRGRRDQRRAELQRVFDLLNIKQEYGQIYVYDYHAIHLLSAVLFATVVSLMGLTSLFLGYELGLAQYPSFPLGGVLITQGVTDIQLDTLIPYQQRAQLAFGMAFLGAYLWGLQNLSRRFSMNDLNPSAFFNLAIRMIFAAVIALLIYHAAFLMIGNESGQDATGEVSSAMLILPAMSFFIGMFPQRGVKWLTEKMQFMGGSSDSGVRALPLLMVEGLEEYDAFRLNEIGIDSCYDLANAEFIPLLLRTPYQPRELIDWMLQAKLIIRVGLDISILRTYGYRTILNMGEMDEATIDELIRDTPLTQSTLRQACRLRDTDEGLEKLIAAGRILGSYWNNPAPCPERDDDEPSEACDPASGSEEVEMVATLGEEVGERAEEASESKRPLQVPS